VASALSVEERRGQGGQGHGGVPYDDGNGGAPHRHISSWCEEWLEGCLRSEVGLTK